MLTGRLFGRVRRGTVGRIGRVCLEPARTASGFLRRTLRQGHNLKEYQSWLVVVAIVALGSAPKGAPVRVEAKVVVRWLLLIAWRYKLSQAE